MLVLVALRWRGFCDLGKWNLGVRKTSRDACLSSTKSKVKGDR